MKRIHILTLVVILLSTQSFAKAIVGPVKLDFGIWYKTVGASRANASNNFVVSFVYTKDIKAHDWVKVWFPTNETVPCQTIEDLRKNSCDGFPPITGGLESPRFVPNKAYFEKYPDSPEKDIGKLYYSTNLWKFGYDFMDVDQQNTPSWDACGMDLPTPKLLKDPTGLGYWMTGAVLPAIPKDRDKRLEFMKEKNHHFSLGDPCVCVDLPFELNSNCRERSFSTVTPLELEAWRKGYNVGKMGFTNKFGIIFPATPGRYRVAVATLPEPVSVESESFIMPCSDVSAVGCNATEFGFSSRNPFTVSFKTGEGGALDNKYSSVTIKLPQEFSINNKLSKRLIKVNGVLLNADPEVTKTNGQTLIKITLPMDVDNFSDVNVEFDVYSYVTFNPDRNESFVEVSTSSEPNFVKSGPVIRLTESGIAIQPPEEFRNCNVSLRLLLDENKTYPPMTLVRATFPEAFKFGSKITRNDVSINGIHPPTDPKVSGNTIEIATPVNVKSLLVIAFHQSCAFVNPGAGFYFIKLVFGSDTHMFDDVFIQPANACIDNLVLSSTKPNSLANLSFGFQPSTFGSLEVGDEIIIHFPSNFVLPKSLTGKLLTFGKTNIRKASTEGSRLKLEAPIRQTVSEKFKFNLNIGMKLPDYLTGSEKILIETSKGDKLEESLSTEEAYGNGGN